MKKLISILMICFVLTAIFIPISSYADNLNSPENNVKIIFDNKNATVKVSVNNTQYFYLKFMKIYLSDSNYLSKPFLVSENINNMQIKKINSYNQKMGNFTKITMWKNLSITPKTHHNHMEKNKILITISFDFYIAEKSYKKKNLTITHNMIRYDTKITTNIKNYYVFLEESLRYGEGSNKKSSVFECNNTHSHWNTMPRTNHIIKHHFGHDHLGILGFGKNNVTFKYMWEYQNNIDTFYSYDGSQLVLYFGFENTNGTIVQDPYISLPVNLSGNPVTLIHTVKHVVSYIMDHLLSLGIGLIIAVVVIFSAPLLKRRRL